MTIDAPNPVLTGTTTAKFVPVPPKPPRARGVDVSSWQHPGGKPIDWAEVYKAGYTFAMIKATQGDYYTNPYLVEDFEGAHAAGLICGAYHFYMEGIAATEQADYFGHALAGRVTELGCYLDWEPGEINVYEAKQLIDEFVAAAEKFRKPIGLYVDAWWWDQLKTTGLRPARLYFADPSHGPLPQGVTIVQRAAGPVAGIEGDTDIDELLSIRGINVPQPPKAAEVPFVESGEAEPGKTAGKGTTSDEDEGTPPPPG